MEKRKMSQYLLILGSMALISGCGAYGAGNSLTSGARVEMEESSPSGLETIPSESGPESNASGSETASAALGLESGEPGTEAVLEPESFGAALEPGTGESGVEDSKQTQLPAPASASVVDVKQTFQGGICVISFQMPEDWSYATDENDVDWGFHIQVQGKEDAFIRIFGQWGTLNVEDFYSNEPESFSSSAGMTGKRYQETRDCGEERYVEGDILLDLGLYGIGSYGISYSMPEAVWNENEEALQELFQSVLIKESIS